MSGITIAKTGIKSVDEYIASQAVAVPEAEEAISHNISLWCPIKIIYESSS